MTDDSHDLDRFVLAQDAPLLFNPEVSFHARAID